jgi:[ribosomal protein S18]-alanine N-acetyltransferase
MIEIMRAQHVKTVAELEKICFSEPWSENSLLEETENPDAYFIVDIEDSELVGYAGMHTPCGDCYVDNIAVFPQFRGKGYGEKLTLALIEKAKTLGEFISLEVRASNIPAIKLYEKLGFLAVGKRKNFYSSPREDAIIYTKSFTEGEKE